MYQGKYVLSLVEGDDDDEGDSGGLNGGAIAGIIIGILAVVGVIIFFIVNKDAQKKLRKSIGNVRTRLRNFRNHITDSLGNCWSRSPRSNTRSTPTTT